METGQVAAFDREGTRPWTVAVDVLVAVLVAVWMAYGFHLLAEKPFMRRRAVSAINGESQTVGMSGQG